VFSISGYFFILFVVMPRYPAGGISLLSRSDAAIDSKNSYAEFLTRVKKMALEVNNISPFSVNVLLGLFPAKNTALRLVCFNDTKRYS